ncbi:MAG: beta-lactamase family protein [Propionibacteriaceae bacterium]|jgi:CubicO group peptidase (beta-lactamase class C family)|nr:beta-lactamase family protein [Propionibacteriaceae bacterium]
MGHSLFDQFRLTVLEHQLGVYGVHVHVDGQPDIEHRFRADDRVHLWSASKTFTSLAVGMCVDEGRFTLSDKILDHFGSCRSIAAPGSQDITVRDLLHMQPGKEYALFQETDESVLGVTDWAELFFAGELKTTPGTHFFYANACTYMLGRLVEATSGTRLRDYLLPRLFNPLHIPNPQWQTCPGGHNTGAFGLHLTTSELARMGQVLLHEGEWDGSQLVSADYVKAMHTDTVSTDHHFEDTESDVGYGYQVWLNTAPGTFRADGMYGQFSIVLPEQRAVVTVTSHNETCANDIVRAVFADIVPKL